jgi:hypothetical protein
VMPSGQHALEPNLPLILPQVERPVYAADQFSVSIHSAPAPKSSTNNTLKLQNTY